MKVLDLFSGIGGFSLGLERAGMETVAFCEIDPFCQKVLNKHWPDIEVFNDITNFKYKKNVDVVTAGFPCQDVSLAGKRAGLSGERTGLFWYVIRALCMVGRPGLLLENVAGLLSRGLGVVLGALASFGYDAEWHCIPASYVGAWQLRDRVWVVAHPNGAGLQKRLLQPNLQGQARRDDYGENTPLGGKRFTRPEVVRRFHGIPSRVDRIKSLGNAVIPQIPEIIGRAIMEQES